MKKKRKVERRAPVHRQFISTRIHQRTTKPDLGVRQRNKQKKLLPDNLFRRCPDGHKSEPKRLSLSSWMKWFLKEEEGNRRGGGGLN
jgi:hypothetical protein